MTASIRSVLGNGLLQRILTKNIGWLDPLERDNAEAFVRRYCERLESVLAHGVRTGQLRADLDTAHTAEIIWALHHSLSPGILVRPDGEWRPDADALLQSALDLVIRGIRR